MYSHKISIGLGITNTTYKTKMNLIINNNVNLHTSFVIVTILFFIHILDIIFIIVTAI